MIGHYYVSMDPVPISFFHEIKPFINWGAIDIIGKYLLPT
jgi:hypothetical protein